MTESAACGSETATSPAPLSRFFHLSPPDICGSQPERPSPFPTPAPVAIGDPDAGYPLPWSVQTWLPGTVATDEDPGESVEFAHDLATFIGAVRAIDTQGRTFAGPGRGGDMWSHDAWVDTCLQRSRHLQLGTLGSRDHFIEVTVDEQDWVWLFLHSGSRGVGNKIAQHHIQVARTCAGVGGLTYPTRTLPTSWNRRRVLDLHPAAAMGTALRAAQPRGDEHRCGDGTSKKSAGGRAASRSPGPGRRPTPETHTPGRYRTSAAVVSGQVLDQVVGMRDRHAVPFEFDPRAGLLVDQLQHPNVDTLVHDDIQPGALDDEE
jgi:tRNA-splicing ligase RtcB/Phosphotransferase enzyme family